MVWLAAGFSGAAFAQTPVPNARAIDVVSRPIPLSGEAPRGQQIGALTYQGGLSLSSTDPAFGGFSGLIVSPDQSHLIAVSDDGSWLCMSLDQSPEGRLTGVSGAWMSQMRSVDAEPLSDRNLRDAEGLTLAASKTNGTAILVSFEAKHRVWRYPLDDQTDLCSVASSVPTDVPLPSGVKRLPGNGGLEAISTLPGERLLVVSEHGKAGAGRLGWILPEAGLSDRPAQQIGYSAPRPYAPTDMTRLDGRLYILQRYFSILSGVSGVVSMMPVGDVTPKSDLLQADTIARLSPPLTVDNFEGISAVRGYDGNHAVFIVSDDNFNRFQQTLLMKFTLPAPRSR